MSILVVKRAQEDAGEDFWESYGRLIFAGAAVLVGLVAIYSGAIYWAARSRRRSETLKLAQPSALVMRSIRVPQLVNALRAAGYDKTFDFNARDFPYGLALVGNGSGLEVWAGSPSSPVEYFSVPWPEVLEVARTNVLELGRTSAGIVISVTGKSLGTPVELPFVIVGRGLGGLYPEKPATLDEHVLTLRSLKAQYPED